MVAVGAGVLVIVPTVMVAGPSEVDDGPQPANTTAAASSPTTGAVLILTRPVSRSGPRPNRPAHTGRYPGSN
jgi:hypothetical protein